MAETASPRFAELDARIRAAVEAVADHPGDTRDPFAGLYLTDEQALALSATGPPAQAEERLQEIAALLELDAIEQGALAVCAAPELSWRYGRLYGYLHDDLTRQLASPRLASALLADGTVTCEQVLARLAPHGRLRHLGAILVLDEPRLPLADQPLKCAGPLAAALIGCASPRPQAPECEIVGVPTLAPAPPGAIEELQIALAAEGEELPLLIAGPDAPAALARALDRPVLLASVSDADDPARLPSLRLATTLARATLAYTGLERLEPERLRRVWQALRSEPERALVCVESSEGASTLSGEPALLVAIPPAALAERLAAWSALLPGCEVQDVAVKFRLSIGQISRAAQIARARAHAQARARSAVSAADLDHGARDASRHGLGGLASRVEADAGWDTLILPERSLQSLHTIAAFLRHRDSVLEQWEAARQSHAPEGLTVLFAGESGTGKTMAARVLAHELGLELYRIDLATVVSKYVGETEKNLDRIFAAAEGSNAILLFDEADALFGKRSEVHDAHDRYANVEVAYLLQRIEAYAGAVILTTNLRQNVDEAFLRRLDLLVDFPFPEAAERERLWRSLLPPHAADAPLDLRLLAERFKLAGGSIRNAALAAALLAAADHSELSEEHLLRAISLEYDKLGRLTMRADFQPRGGKPKG